MKSSIAIPWTSQMPLWVPFVSIEQQQYSVKKISVLTWEGKIDRVPGFQLLHYHARTMRLKTGGFSLPEVGL